MVEEGGVEPPFWPILSCSYLVSLSEALLARRPISKKDFFTFLLFYLFTFNPFHSLRAPCIPATSVLPGYVARLVR